MKLAKQNKKEPKEVVDEPEVKKPKIVKPKEEKGAL